MTTLFSGLEISLKIAGKTLLNNVSLAIPAAQITVLMGPNGAGKTLLLKVLAGMLSPHEGRLEGADGLPLLLGDEKEWALWRTWVPSSQTLPFDFKVIDLVQMGRLSLHQGFPGATDLKASLEALRKLGIEHLKDRSFNSLSRGEQTKVDIARAIAHTASLLILDEPFANLDIDSQLHLSKVLRSLVKEGRTVLLSHHDLYSIPRLADSVAFIKQGQLIAAGPKADVFIPSLIHQVFGVQVTMCQHPKGQTLLVTDMQDMME